MFKSSKANMVIALILAIGLWCYVVYAVNPVQSEIIKGIPVQFENEQALNDRGLSIANSTKVTIDLSVEGARQVIAGTTADDFTARADVSECIEGDNILEVSVECGKDLKRTSNTTITVHVTVEPIITVEKKIKIEGSEKVAGTSDVIEYELLGSGTVSVTGAKSLCESIDYIKANVPGQIESEEENMEVQLAAVNERNVRVPNVKLSQKTVSVKAVRYGFKDVSFNVSPKGKTEGYEGMDIPETVKIKGKHSNIDDIDQIKAQPVDISNMKESQEVELVPILPDGVVIDDSSLPLIAVVKIDSESSREMNIEAGDIQFEGLAEGLRAVADNGSIKVKVTGEVSDIVISADLTGLEAGAEADVPLVLEYKGEGKAELLTENIKVKIEEE